MKDHSLEGLHARIKLLEERVTALEPKFGYICRCCKQSRPASWYIYEAKNSRTGEVMMPVCGKCAQGCALGSEWGYSKPIKPVK